MMEVSTTQQGIYQEWNFAFAAGRSLFIVRLSTLRTSSTFNVGGTRKSVDCFGWWSVDLSVKSTVPNPIS